MTIFTDADPRGHARKTVTAALVILQQTAQLKRELPGGVEPIAVHLGVDSGRALVGTTRLEGKHGVHWTYTASGCVPIVGAPGVRPRPREE